MALLTGMTDEQNFMIQHLGLHPSALRLKKLMIYACHNCWENDAQRLNAIDWQSLAQELRYRNPTPEHLRACLDALVVTLNKPTEYLPLISTITEALKPLYTHVIPPWHDPEDDDIPTQIEYANPPIDSELDALEPLSPQGLTILERDPDLIRIKKLLICTARNYWETDTQTLASTSLPQLVTELQAQHPTQLGLQTAITQVVQNLSKPLEYRRVANVILQHISELFVPPSPGTRIPPVLETESTESVELTVPDPGNLPRTAQNQPPSPQTAIQRAHESSVDKPLDLFDLRLEIMKFTNPLRAKILLFSILYHDFDFTGQDWDNLKLYSLDGLLRNLLNVCDTWDAVVSNLQDAADRQRDPETSQDVASALMKALKPVYNVPRSHIQQIIKPFSVADATQVIHPHHDLALEISEDATEARMPPDATAVEGSNTIVTRWNNDEATATNAPPQIFA
jgi:hypothetical protein